jgi:hypothetical protein
MLVESYRKVKCGKSKRERERKRERKKENCEAPRFNLITLSSIN